MRQTPQRMRVSPRHDDPHVERVPVRIGEIRVADGDSLLFTVGLGSCVAIVLYDARTRIGGLAHSMLPTPASGRSGATAPVGRFASTAVPELIRMMERAGAARRRLDAWLAGGASMFRDVLDSEGLRLGRRNVEAAREALSAAGLTVRGQDVYGTYGRSVWLRTADGELLITSVNNPDVRL